MKKTMKDRRCGGLISILLLLLGSVGTATAADQVYVCTPCPAGYHGDGQTNICCPNGYLMKRSGGACPAGYRELASGQACPAGYVENNFGI
ncbi:MAG: hypothetical protein LBO78_01155 [Rickettsiales bacterium]|jgi:hypothetical protein|nr:hypothetical protein [Rickettsiales bacterium]